MEMSITRNGECTIEDIDWGCTPRTRILVDQLTALDHFPFVGEVEDKKNNPALEAFRKAQNVVYDIFNNAIKQNIYSSTLLLWHFKKNIM